MGQTLSQSDRPTRTREELRRELANKFAEKCFTSIELYSLKDNFKSLADVQPNAGAYLKEDTLVRFLEIPDVLQVSPVLFHMASFLGAFPLLNDAPAVLGLEEMVIVVTLLTKRYERVLSKGASDRRKLLFKSLAVYDRKLSELHDEKKQEDEDKDKDKNKGEEDSGAARSHVPGFAIDEAGDDEPDDGSLEEGEDDDDLVLSAFQSLDYVDAVKLGSRQTVHGAMIPADNFRRLVTLLLLIAPLDAQERLSQYSLQAEDLRSTADSILAAFLNVEKSPGVKFRAFDRILGTLPFMFDGLNALFEHFLFSKNLDFGKHKTDHEGQASGPPRIAAAPVAPILLETGAILNHAVLSQLSFFIPGSDLFRRLRPLYSGDKDGFSMGSFESAVFNWRAPTILLVRGTRLDSSGNGNGSEERFVASLPPKRFPDGSTQSDRVTFGLYVSQPWRQTPKDCFGDPESMLFQLEPIHDVFRASTLNRDYVSFLKSGGGSAGGGGGSGSWDGGVAAGNPPPRPSASHRREGFAPLGPVSLLLDASFEFGVFSHDYTSRGGAFQNSTVRRFNFQDRFEVESLEVWGCGGDAEAKAQADRWAFEKREAEARRRINLGTGDIEADRALLEMAGLVGANRSGGSMA